MKKTKFLACVMACAVTASVSSISFAANFRDISQSHWAFQSIIKLQSCGVIDGFQDGTFRPNQAITRAEFAKMVTQLYCAEEEFDIMFADVSSHAWYADAAETMAGFMPSYIDEQNIVRFRPNERLSRGDAAASILCFFGKFDWNVDTQGIAEFADASQMSNFEQLVVANALREGIMNGKNGSFDVRGSMTRAEMSALLSRVSEKGWRPVLHGIEAFSVNILHHPDGNRKGEYYIPFSFTEQEKPEQPIIPDEPQKPEQKPPIQQKPEKPLIPQQPPTQQKPDKPSIPQSSIPSDEDTSSQISYEKQVLSLVNQERAKQGLSALVWSDELANVARAHSKDMAKRNFFSHTNPDGQSPFDRMKAAGIRYATAGENIAAGQRTPQEVVRAWMNSEGHRANILNKNYTKLGIGYVSGIGSYGTYWTQCFAG